MRLEFGHAHAVLAREFMQAPEPVFGLGERVRVEVERALVARERIAGFGELDLRRVDEFADRREPRIECDEARDLRLRTREPAQQCEFVVAVEAVGESRAALQQLPAVGEAAVALLECLQIVGRERVGVQFLELVREPFDALGMVRAAAEFGDARGGLAPCACASRHGGELVAVGAERIEQDQLLAAIEQRLVLVLAVDLEQLGGQRAQLAGRHRASIDPRARAAFAADHATKLAGAVLVEVFLDQPVAQVGTRGEVERGRELGAFAAVANHRRIGAATGQKHQRVDQQRFARAGFTGDDGHAGPERDFGFADDREILDVETFEHAGARPVFAGAA